MTTVTSVEQFDGIEVGEFITVGDNSNRWQRVEGGWEKSGFILESHHFSGDIGQSRVTIGVRPEAGQMWSNEGHPNFGYTYLLIMEENQQWWVARIYEGAYCDVRQVSGDIPGKLVTEEPDWKANVLNVARHVVNERRSLTAERDAHAAVSRELVERRRNGEREVTEFRAKLQEQMHAYAAEHELNADEAFGKLLTDNGMSRPKVKVEVTVKVSGASYVTVSPEQLAQFVPGSVSVSRGSDIHLAWDREFKHEVEVEAGGHTCGSVSRNECREILASENVSVSSFSHTISCDVCNRAMRQPF